jgi:hypothetical protein
MLADGSLMETSYLVLLYVLRGMHNLNYVSPYHLSDSLCRDAANINIELASVGLSRS